MLSAFPLASFRLNKLRILLLNNIIDEQSLIFIFSRLQLRYHSYFTNIAASSTIIDHVFASESLSCDFTNFKIIDSGCNNSDHNPIAWHIEWSNDVPVCSNFMKQQQRCLPQLNWNKADVVLYYNLTGQMLQNINVPTHVFYESMHCE